MTEYTLDNLPDLPTKIAARLQSAPPGRSYQERFAPELCYGRHFGPPGAGARRAAVIILLYAVDGNWSIALTRRSSHLKDHAGQISLPGGATHDDESSQEAARRELEEELNVSQTDVRILGELSTIYLFVSDFVVTPIVGYAEPRPNFRPDPNEVARLIEAPLQMLMDHTNLHTRLRKIGRRPPTSQESANEYSALDYSAPEYSTSYIAIEGNQVWGATAVLLGEFMRVIEEVTQD